MRKQYQSCFPSPTFERWTNPAGLLLQPQVALVCAPGLQIVDIGVPGHRWRHISQLIELFFRAAEDG